MLKIQIRYFISFVLRHGLYNTYRHYYKNRLFEIPMLSQKFSGQTSVTDSKEYETYLHLCSLATDNQKIFDNFRTSEPIYKAIDHVSLVQGKLFLKAILKKSDFSPEISECLQDIDRLGNPRKYKFNPYGVYSPLLLRYLNTYLNLRDYFGSLSNLNIVEIGGGFGGQAGLISKLCQPSSYRLYDLPVVIKLQEKFIHHLSVPGNFYFHSKPESLNAQIDLVISNYAFSELSKDTQDNYLQDLVLKSSKGYITWNKLGYKLCGGYSLAELIRIIPNSQIYPDNPNFDSSNNIIVWGSSKKFEG
jgi:putative sugar O-methyltransferase